MERLSELRQGLEEAWQSVSDGWRHLRDRAAGALTRYTPTKPSSTDEGGRAAAREGGRLFSAASWALLAGDVYEDNDRVVVRLEMPGLDKQDLEVEVRSDVLVVRGEKKLEDERTEGRYRLRQCAYGSFHRAIPLPVPVETDKATARYTDGVLRIELPKAEHARGRRVTISSD